MSCMKYRYLLTVLLLLLHGAALSGVPVKQFRFGTVGREAGLSHVTVNAVWQDGLGRMWFGTRYGLDSYDGNAIRSDYTDSHGFSIPLVHSISGHEGDVMYLRAHNSLVRFDARTETFREIAEKHILAVSAGKDCIWFCAKNSVFRYLPGKDEIEFVAETGAEIRDAIYCMTEDRNDNCWIGSSAGVFRIGPDDKVTTEYPDISARSIFEDSSGNLWFCTTDKGLFVKTPEGSMRRIMGVDGDIRCICESNDGNLWIGAREKVYVLNPRTAEIFRAVPDAASGQATLNGSVTALYKDRQGTIWISTYFGGVCYVNPDVSGFEYLTPPARRKGQSPVIGKFCQDTSGLVWIATEGDGLYSYDRAASRFRSYGWGSNPNMKELFYDIRRNCLWIGFYENGMDRFDIATGKFHSYGLRRKNLKIMEWKDRFLIGSSQTLSVFDPDRPQQDPEPFFKDNDDITVMSLLSDDEGNIWIGTNQGVLRYTEGEEISVYRNSVNDDNTISGDFITAMSQDKDGNIWLVAMGKGLNRYNPDDGTFVRHTTWSHGLADNSITAMAVSGSGCLLLGTGSGLTVFDPRSGRTGNYDTDTGFPFPAVNEGSLFEAADGTVYAGGVGGFAVFTEKSLSRSVSPDNIWFSELYIDNEKILPGGSDGILSESLPYTDTLRLGPECRRISLKTAIDNYISHNRITVQYRLSGHADDWMVLQTDQMITYTNLSPGKYLLEVRVMENPEISGRLHLFVEPPIYATWYAYLFYLLLAALAVYSVYRESKTRMQMRAALEFEKLEKEKTEEFISHKLDFFTNISHELNTPLTMIIAQIDTVLGSYSMSAPLKNKLLNVYKNTKDIKNLISELIEFRRQEENDVSVHLSRTVLPELVEKVYADFSEYAAEKGIELRYVPAVQHPVVLWADAESLRKAINNIVSNALKFTPAGGTVIIGIHDDGTEAFISVSDTGPGIPEDKISHVFEQFYQVNSGSCQGGFGIGLAFARNIVSAHNGRISARNKPGGRGAVLEIALPEEKTSAAGGNNLPGGEPAQQTFNEDAVRKRFKIVIIEDNMELADLLASEFSKLYHVTVAHDAEDGLEKIRKTLPDLIISDIMLPGMSGTELCRIVKNSMDTSHIPLVLLTAKSAVRYELEGLNAGADDYVTKPFDIYLLLARCNNLMNNRKLLQERYFSRSDTASQMVAMTPLDYELMDKATSFVLANIENDSLNIDTFAREMGMSRTSLFNKIKGVTGVSPNRFILNMKLKKASEMLLENPEMPVSEIAYRLGFYSPKYFTSCFKKLFSCTPSEFRKKG